MFARLSVRRKGPWTCEVEPGLFLSLEEDSKLRACFRPDDLTFCILFERYLDRVLAAFRVHDPGKDKVAFEPC